LPVDARCVGRAGQLRDGAVDGFGSESGGTGRGKRIVFGTVCVSEVGWAADNQAACAVSAFWI